MKSIIFDCEIKANEFEKKHDVVRTKRRGSQFILFYYEV